MAINMGKAIAYLELDTTKFTSGFASAYNDLKVFGDKSATVEQVLKGMSSAFKTTGSLLSKSLTLPIVGVGVAAVKTTADFESAMSEVKAISGATASEFQKLEQKAIEMGAKTKFSAGESAEAFKYMAMAGWDTSQMMDGIAGVMDLAAASGENLATTSDIVTDALTAFGLQASDSAHFADVLAQASSKSNTNVGLMGETFKYVAPVAGALGYSVEDTAVAIGLMANSGIKATQAGTSLRQIITRLAKPVGEAETAVNDLGISITNSDGTMKPFSETIVELREKFAGLTEEQKAQYAAMLAGQEGMSGLLAIVNASEADFQNLTNEINNADGAAKEMAETMMDNTKGAVEQLKGAVESAGIVVGKQLTPYIRNLAEWLTKSVEKFNSLSEAEQKNITKWLLIVAAIGPFLLIASKVLTLLSKLVTITKVVVKSIQTLKLAFDLLKLGMAQSAMQVVGLDKVLIGLSNALMVATNPVVLLTSTFGLLTAGLLMAEEQEKRQIEKLAELKGKEKELADEIDKMSESYSTMMDNRNNSLKSIEEESGKTQALANELRGLVDENGRVTEGNEERANIITGLLSDALGQEISIVDGVITNYQELCSQIDITIERQKALAIQEAMTEDYKQAIKDQADARANYNKQLENQLEHETRVNEIKATMARKQDEWNRMSNQGRAEASKASEEHAKLSKELEAEEKALKKSTKETKKAKETFEGYNSTIRNYEGLSEAIVSGDADAMSLAMLKIQENFKVAGEATVDTLAEQKDKLKEQYEEMQEELANGNTSITQDMIDEMGTLLAQADEQLTAGIEQQKQALLNTFTELGIELPESMMGTLSSTVPEVQQTVLMMLDGLKNGTALKGEELKLLFASIGLDVPNSLITSLQNQTPSVQAQAISLLTQLKTAESSQRESILSQLRELGIQVDNNLMSGLDSKKGEVKKKGEEVGKTANKGIETETKKDVDAPKVKEIENATQVGQNAWNKIKGALSGAIPVAATVAIGFAGKSIPGHANGLDYVPYNGYLAKLHKGERVLTKQQNEVYNKGSERSGDVFNFYNTKPDPYEYARQMKKAKRDLEYGY